MLQSLPDFCVNNIFYENESKKVKHPALWNISLLRPIRCFQKSHQCGPPPAGRVMFQEVPYCFQKDIWPGWFMKGQRGRVHPKTARCPKVGLESSFQSKKAGGENHKPRYFNYLAYTAPLQVNGAGRSLSVSPECVPHKIFLLGMAGASGFLFPIYCVFFFLTPKI